MMVLKRSLIYIMAFCIMPGIFSQSSLNGSWRFMSYRNILTNYFKVQSYSSYRYGSIMLNFKDSLGVGTFSGHTISNTINGEYQIIDDKTVLFTNVTKGLFDETSEIMDIRIGLKGSTKYEAGDNNLKIIYNNGQEEMNFVRVNYDLKGTWKIKQLTDRENNNPNKSYNEALRFHFEGNKLIIYNANDRKKTIEKNILQTNLFHKFTLEDIKKGEIEKKGIDPIVMEIFADGLKYESYLNQLFLYSDRFRVELIPAEP
ncbi:MAG: hypothetical protein JXB49_12690 [Bacteroidales bacterium]|nr:hypothetical protein [Bacteroidales bacterium]